MRHSILLTIAVLAAGCATTPMVWTKTGATEVSVAADLRECHKLADDQAWRMSWARRWPPAFYNPRYMPPYYHNPRPFWLGYPMSLETQQALVEFCMHSKGYRLERLPY